MPEVVFVPLQLPEAVQLSALDDDQVRVIAVPTSTSVLLAERLTDIVWIGSGVGAGAETPPPPHAVIIKRHTINAQFFILIKNNLVVII